MPFKSQEDYQQYQAAYYVTHRKKRIAEAQQRRQQRLNVDAGLMTTIQDPRTYVTGMLKKICGLMGATLEPALREDCIQEGLEAMFRARFETSNRRMLARVSSAMRRYINKQRSTP